jgi:hypothetical protein
MKNLVFIFLMFAPLALFSAQTPGLDAISSALSTGDAGTLSKYFGDQVEIVIDGQGKTYSRAQATDVVRSFFAANKPQGFSAMHKGQSRENSDLYCIGKMVAGAGNYRVSIYYKEGGGNAQIQQLRFDKN